MTRFNTLELSFKYLVGLMAGLKSRMVPAVFTHLNAPTLISTLRAISTELSLNEDARDELEFMCKLFEANAQNRNLAVHSIYYQSIGNEHGLLLTKRSARGKVKIDQYLIPLEVLRCVADEIWDAEQYVGLIIGPLSVRPHGQNISLPYRPPLPKMLQEQLPRASLADLFGS